MPNVSRFQIGPEGTPNASRRHAEALEFANFAFGNASGTLQGPSGVHPLPIVENIVDKLKSISRGATKSITRSMHAREGRYTRISSCIYRMGTVEMKNGFLLPLRQSSIYVKVHKTDIQVLILFILVQIISYFIVLCI